MQLQDGKYLKKMKVLSEYYNTNTPNAIMNVINPSIHPLFLYLATRGVDSTIIYRYSGDRFYTHRVVKPWQKPINYLVNNMVGRLSLLVGDKFVTLGPNGTSRLERRNINTSNVVELPPTFDETRFNDTRSTTPIHIEGKTVLFVGRLSYLKGRRSIEKVIPKVVDSDPTFNFVFIGEILEKLDIPERYNDNVHYVGPVEPDHVVDFYNAADVLIQPSLSEGFGRTVPEALLCGVPVIARDVGEMPKLTNNIFNTDEELCSMVLNHQGLPLDNADHLLRSNQRESHLEFFESL
ncbi:glycosyltransferase family 4 protein [Haloarchaeobius sp. DYHT-AS-18]|uniref:glycosyltransferase family 4 protein n=1 Tax=Haloarchaeobius sp. DYHT-AS-18 TaxID=3446117 RepID=UPI003EBD9EDB